MAFKLEDLCFKAANLCFERGTILSDGLGNVSIKCRKHPHIWINVRVLSAFDVTANADIMESINEALDQCLGCIEEKQWAATRFPENAEL